jgi:hypothetical protein
MRSRRRRCSRSFAAKSYFVVSIGSSSVIYKICLLILSSRSIYLTKACRTCPLKDQCTTSNERRIKRCKHEHVVEAAQTRIDQNPQAMRVRRETVEHPFATLKMRMGAAHFLMKTLPKVATDMALHGPRLQPSDNLPTSRHRPILCCPLLPMRFPRVAGYSDECRC